MNRHQLQTLSTAREHEASILLEARRYAGALYLMGYAVECALKACIARMTQRHDFPDKTRTRVSWTHDLEVLLRTSGLWREFTEAMERDLDGSGLAPRAAFWLHQPEHRRWKLVLAEEGIDSRGPLAVIADVGRVLESLEETISHIKLYDLSFLGPDEPLIRSLTRAEARGPSLAGMRLMGDFVEDRMIEEAYIYRLRKPAA